MLQDSSNEWGDFYFPFLFVGWNSRISYPMTFYSIGVLGDLSFLFFSFFHWYPCWSLWWFFFWVFRYLWPINFTIYVHSSCHWPVVINMFDKMPQWKDHVIFKEFGYRLFIQLFYFHEKSLVQSSRLILGPVITWILECCLTLIRK